MLPPRCHHQDSTTTMSLVAGDEGYRKKVCWQRVTTLILVSPGHVTWPRHARTVDVRPRPGANVQCLPVRKTAGWKATDIAGFRSGGARAILPPDWGHLAVC